MSWASRRRATYLGGVIVFFVILVGGPVAYWYFRIPTTCSDGIQNQGETAVDKGGPCQLLDERTLTPEAVSWSRAFSVRGGSYNAVAYVENPNPDAGVRDAPYRVRLYDSANILVAEREGDTVVMPGTVTPVFVGSIDTGNRTVSRAYFEFTAPLVWERLSDATRVIRVTSKKMDTTSPRLVATVQNTSVADIQNVQFVAVIFDTAGNAFAASSTVIPSLRKGTAQDITFTWPDPFPYVPNRIDVLPILPPGRIR